MRTVATAAVRGSRSHGGVCAVATLVLACIAVNATVARAQSRSGAASGSIRAEWLQANALPFTRDAAPSASAAFEFRRPAWSIEVGWLRVARKLSTVQGGFIGITRPIHFGNAVLLPGVAVLGGVAEASRDSTGYDFIGGTPPVQGRQPRYTYSESGAAGGGATLAFEFPARSTVSLRASGAQWYFTGKPLTGDRNRTVAGVGLVVRFGLASRAALTPTRRITPGREP
jgi:hypothetical protein